MVNVYIGKPNMNQHGQISLLHSLIHMKSVAIHKKKTKNNNY